MIGTSLVTVSLSATRALDGTPGHSEWRARDAHLSTARGNKTP